MYTIYHMFYKNQILIEWYDLRSQWDLVIVPKRLIIPVFMIKSSSKSSRDVDDATVYFHKQILTWSTNPSTPVEFNPMSLLIQGNVRIPVIPNTADSPCAAPIHNGVICVFP
jgi:hypothetical protein